MMVCPKLSREHRKFGHAPPSPAPRSPLPRAVNQLLIFHGQELPYVAHRLGIVGDWKTKQVRSCQPANTNAPGASKGAHPRGALGAHELPRRARVARLVPHRRSVQHDENEAVKLPAAVDFKHQPGR